MINYSKTATDPFRTFVSSERKAIYEHLHEHRDGNREGGTGGGLPDFAEGVELVYSISFYNGHAYLDVAVLIRHEDSHSRFQSPKPEFLEPPPEASGQGGGGGSSGGHMFYCDSGSQTLFMDGAPLMSVHKTNVVLLDDAVDQPPKVVGTDSINDHLGVVDLGTDAMHRWYMTLHQRLQNLLRNSTAVQDFIGP